MVESFVAPARDAWAVLQGYLYFLPPFPARPDTLALLSLLLVTGLLVAEWLRHNAQSHRDQIILDQARRIEQCGELVEQGLRELLEGLVTEW